ncbi:multidrug effflux MFS transporter [Agarivorans sp.]|uniref:multidrug effflux MFS transporter n=1 Tax=Agarivorans sp. TaxID=1872412 RepID=UPI003CFC8FC6
MQHSISKQLVVFLAAVFAMTPYAIDSYLPAIPSIAESFGVKTSMVAVTVSMYVFGMAVGQLIGGPLSDKRGRKFAIITGLSVFALGSLILAFSDSLEYFWFWRVFQSVGGGIAVVGVPATIRDNADGREAAKLFSLIMLIMMIAPSIAPSVGAFINAVSSWHWIFISSGVIAIVVAIWGAAVLPANKPSKAGDKSSLTFLQVLQNRKARGYLIAQAFSYTVLMVFITNAPFAYIDHFQASEKLFSGLFIVNIVGLVIANRVNSYLLNKHDPESLLARFLSLQVLGGLVLIASIILAPSNIWFAVVGFVLCMAAHGGTMSNASASFLKHFKHGAGTASALLGAVQFFTGAIISAISALLTEHSLWPMVLIMLASTATALISTIKTNQNNLNMFKATEVEC